MDGSTSVASLLGIGVSGNGKGRGVALFTCHSHGSLILISTIDGVAREEFPSPTTTWVAARGWRGQWPSEPGIRTPPAGGRPASETEPFPGHGGPDPAPLARHRLVGQGSSGPTRLPHPGVQPSP